MSSPLKDLKVHTIDGDYFIFRSCVLGEITEEEMKEMLEQSSVYFEDGITHNKTVIKTEYIVAIEVRGDE